MRNEKITCTVVLPVYNTEGDVIAVAQLFNKKNNTQFTDTDEMVSQTAYSKRVSNSRHTSYTSL